jgi:hypothetical protein
MPYNGSVTAQQAAEARRAKLSIPNKRRVPDMLGLIQTLKDSKKYRIFNVGPWAHIVPTGSTGTFFIPPCPTEKECLDQGIEYKPYVEMTRPIDAIMDELIVKSEAEMDRLMDDGRQFALEIVGEGRGRNPAYSLRHYGVFLAEGETPTAKELADANRALRDRCSEIVAEIRSIFATDQKLFRQVVTPKVHYVAAWVLNLMSEKWMTDSTPSGQVKCKMCGRMSDADVAMCEGGHIINPEKYQEYVAEQEAMLEAGSAGVAKPKGKK